MSNGALDSHKVTIAKLWAVSRHPYLSAALFAFHIVPVPGLGRTAVDTAWRLYLDPEIVDTYSIEVLGSLMVHHAGHLIRDHAARSQALGVDRRAQRDWALAADAEINDDLVGTGLRLPEECQIYPQSLGWAPGRLAEEYFHAEHDQAAEGEPDCGSGADGLSRDWELSGDQSSGLPPGEQRLLRSQVASDVLRYSKEGMGRLSAGWKRWAQDMLEPTVDWRRVLAAEVRKGINLTAGRVDYTYRRPSRRASACPGVILPAMEQPVPEVAVVCDTSGSMADDLLARVVAEVDGILKGIGLARNHLRVLSVDAAVKSVQRVADTRQLNLIGGGGTDMGTGLRAAARLRPRPSVIVVLTDGFTPWPDDAPRRIPVVVGLVGGEHARRGRVWAPPEWARIVRVELSAPAAA